MVRYDEHAEFQIARRGIEKSWIEDTILNPDAVETQGTRRSYFKCLSGRHIMLRVVTAEADPEYVITAYFDRTRTCV
jgi:hypothetical protein